MVGTKKGRQEATDMKKKFVMLMIGIASTVLMAGCISHLGHDTKIYTEENMEYFGSDKKTIEPVTSLDINSGYANLEIIASDNYYIEYSYYYITKEPKLTINDGVLSFDDSDMNSGSYSVNLHEENYLKLYIPMQAEFDSVVIHKSSGDMNLGSINAKTADIENSYGDTVVSNCSFQDLSLDSSSGSMVFEKSSITKAAIKEAYGELMIKDIRKQDEQEPNSSLTVTMSSGDLKIDGLSTGLLDLENSYGNIEIRDSNVNSVSGKLSSGNFTLGSTMLDSLVVENSYGEVHADLIEKEENYRLDIHNSYGRIKIGSVTLEDKEYQSNAGTKLIKVDASSGDVKITFDNGTK